MNEQFVVVYRKPVNLHAMDPSVPTTSQNISNIPTQIGQRSSESDVYILQNVNTNVSTDITISTQLASRYASNSADLNELAALLVSWNLGEYFEFFQRKCGINKFIIIYYSLDHFSRNFFSSCLALCLFYYLMY